MYLSGISLSLPCQATARKEKEVVCSRSRKYYRRLQHKLYNVPEWNLIVAAMPGHRDEGGERVLERAHLAKQKCHFSSSFGQNLVVYGKTVEFTIWRERDK